MKKIPMILLLIAPYAILVVYTLMPMDMTIPVCVYGGLLLFNLVYAFALPRLGFRGKQLLRWNLLLKLCNMPLVTLVSLFVLVMTMFSGEVDIAVLGIGTLVSCLIQLSSSVFGISGFLWCRKYGTLSKAGVVASSIVQLLPCVDVIGSILCYIMFRKEGEPKD